MLTFFFMYLLKVTDHIAMHNYYQSTGLVSQTHFFFLYPHMHTLAS